MAINFLDAIPELPFFLGFLREFRSRTDEEKIQITNKLAKIISGASIDFMIGFAGGFLRGIWEGVTDPFILIYHLNSLNKKATSQLRCSLFYFRDYGIYYFKEKLPAPDL